MNSLWAQAYQFVISLLFWLVASIVIGLRYPYFLAAQLVWVFTFTRAKSTKVPLDPAAVPVTQIVRLSYHDYDQWAQKYSNIAEDYYSRDDVHWTEKMGILTASSAAKSHVRQPSPATLKMVFVAFPLGLFLFFPNVEAYVEKYIEGLPTEQQIALQVFTGLLLGYFTGSACGQFYRWLRAKL